MEQLVAKQNKDWKGEMAELYGIFYLEIEQLIRGPNQPSGRSKT